MVDIDLRGKMRYCQKLKNDLRQRFRSEYLGQLRENVKLEENRKLNVGDLVLVGNDDRKRIDWPLGIIVTAYPGRDGNVRIYRVKTKQGELTRPIQRLYPLELDRQIVKELDGGFPSDVANDRVIESRDQFKETYSKSNVLNKKPVTETNPPSKYVTRSGREVKLTPKLNI